MPDLNKEKRLPQQFKIKGEAVNNPFRETYTAERPMRVKAFADKLKTHLIKMILKYGTNRTVVGCVAWFSDPHIIAALARCKRVLILVNDEEFGTFGNGNIASRFNALPCFKEPFWQAFKHLDTPLNKLELERKVGCSYLPVRCFGARTAAAMKAQLPGAGAKRPATSAVRRTNARGFVRGGNYMHSKYVIFFDEHDRPAHYWWGSMNFTKNSDNNQEGAHAFYHDPGMATFWFNDFANTFLLSGSLSYGMARKSKPKPKALGTIGRQRRLSEPIAGSARAAGTRRASGTRAPAAGSKATAAAASRGRTRKAPKRSVSAKKTTTASRGLKRKAPGRSVSAKKTAPAKKRARSTTKTATKKSKPTVRRN